MTVLDGDCGPSPSPSPKHAAVTAIATATATRPLSNSERKRQARARVEVERLRAARASAGEITAFRTEEQYWKDRIVEPDWRHAYGHSDYAVRWTGTVDLHGERLDDGHWEDRHGRSWRVRRCPLPAGRTAILFPDKPGLVFLPGHLAVAEQRNLISACLTETTGPASRTNLDTHYVPPAEGWWSANMTEPERLIQPRRYTSPSEGASSSERQPTKRLQVDLPPMTAESFEANARAGNIRKDDPEPGESVQPTLLRTLIRRLRWTILGLEYHWGTKSYKWDRPPMPMPTLITALTSRIISSIPWSAVFPSSATFNGREGVSDRAFPYSSWATSYRPEAGVVNFYQARDTLTAHVDQSEVDAVKPLVSISLGESAIFLLGTESRDEIPLPLLLQSGDVVVMSGPSRRVFHGVPRIVEGAMRADLLNDWEGAEEIVSFMQGTRINVNVRHVYESS